MGSRAQPQPLRYSGQYHAVQAAPAFVPPTSQSVSRRKIHVISFGQFISGALLFYCWIWRFVTLFSNLVANLALCFSRLWLDNWGSSCIFSQFLM